MRNLATFPDSVSLLTRLHEQRRDLPVDCKVLVLGEQPSNVNSANITFCPAARYTSLLGQEFDIVIYDLRASFRASIFLVLSGLVRGDGWLFLTNPDEAFSGLTFSFNAAENVAESAAKRTAENAAENSAKRTAEKATENSAKSTAENALSKKPSYLLQHLLAHIPKHFDVLSDDFFKNMGSESFTRKWQEQQQSAMSTQQAIRADIVTFIVDNLSVHQKSLDSTHRIVQNQGSTTYHHVITAPRGRGKSYLLGQIINDLGTLLPSTLLANALLPDAKSTVNSAVNNLGQDRVKGAVNNAVKKAVKGGIKIGVITQNRQHLEVLLGQNSQSTQYLQDSHGSHSSHSSHDSQHMQGSKSSQHPQSSQSYQHPQGSQSSQYFENMSILPPDADFTQYPVFDVVVIDEAASFPVELLLHYRKHAKHLIYGTTTHGYEGTGMGFTHKYLPQVMTTDTIQQYTLSIPFRFMSPCPIEAVCDEVLFNDVSDNEEYPFVDGLHWVSTKTLREHTDYAKAMLSALLRLLSLAHYQTTPDDLQRIIDSDDMRCLTYVQNSSLVGCVWIIEEGLQPCPHHLKQAMLYGSRRVSGHLTVQQIAHGYHIPELLEWQIWRINRIAVVPHHQQQGIGKLMINAVIQDARANTVHAVTSSFGAESGLVAFWEKQGFMIWKEGQKANKVTGYHNCIVGMVLGQGDPIEQVAQEDSKNQEEPKVQEDLKYQESSKNQEEPNVQENLKCQEKPRDQDRQQTQEEQLESIEHNVNRQIQTSYQFSQQWQSLIQNNISTVSSKNHLGQDPTTFTQISTKLDVLDSPAYENSVFVQNQLTIIRQFIAGSRSLENTEASIFWFITTQLNTSSTPIAKHIKNNQMLLDRYQRGYAIKACCEKYKITGKKMFSERVKQFMGELL